MIPRWASGLDVHLHDQRPSSPHVASGRDERGLEESVANISNWSPPLQDLACVGVGYVTAAAEESELARVGCTSSSRRSASRSVSKAARRRPHAASLVVCRLCRLRAGHAWWSSSQDCLGRCRIRSMKPGKT